MATSGGYIPFPTSSRAHRCCSVHAVLHVFRRAGREATIDPWSMRAHTLVQPKNAARRGGGAVSGAVSYIKNRSQLPSTLCESFSTLHGWEVMLQLRSRLSARRRAVLGRNASPDRAVSGSRSLLRTKTTAPTHKNRRGDLLGCVCRERSGRACAHRLSCGRKGTRRCGSPIVELWVDRQVESSIRASSAQRSAKQREDNHVRDGRLQREWRRRRATTRTGCSTPTDRKAEEK